MITMREIGRWRVWYVRLASYLGIVNFAMLIHLTLIQNPNIWYLVPLGIIGLGVLLYIDIKHILPFEAGYGFAKTPQNAEMNERLKRIEDILARDKQ